MRKLAALLLALSFVSMPAANAAPLPYDPILCPLFASMAGDHELDLGGDGEPDIVLVSIKSNGDVYVDGELYWKCPPYHG